jgi:DNA-binding Lrp family transcriptional regulator
MTVTPRDRELFRHLSNYGMLSTKQIKEIIFGGTATTTVLRRLRILEEERFIKRLHGLESQEVLWTITDKAFQFGGGEHFKRHWNKNLLEHDFKLLRLRLLLEKRGIAKSWVPEHEIRFLVFKKYDLRTAKEKLIPDGLMVTEASFKKVSVAIELELTLKNKERLKEVLKRYLEKKDLSCIWYVCGSKMVANAIRDNWNKVKGCTTIQLKIALWDEVMKNPTAHFPAQGVSTQGWKQRPRPMV